MEKYICNKASDKKCPIPKGCTHAFPHSKIYVSENYICTKIGECYFGDNGKTMKIKCVNINSKTGKKVLEDKKNIIYNCPFCDKSIIYDNISTTISDDQIKYQIKCGSCGMMGPISYILKDSINKWNELKR